MNNYTTYLFSTPSFAKGVGRIFDIKQSLSSYNTSATEIDADNTAISNDWKAIGNDLNNSLKNYEKEITKN